MFYKVVYILISLRGDSKSMRYVVTLHTTHNVEIYILMYLDSVLEIIYILGFFAQPKKYI